MNRMAVVISVMLIAFAGSVSAQSAESRYQVVENWATFPDGVTAWSAATGVDIDPRN